MLILHLSFAQTTNSAFAFKFTDSSVPPPYHRSYTIVVDNANVHLTINSYGDILLDENYTINTDQYNSFTIKLNSLGLKKKPTTKDNGCTGGTTDSFDFKIAEKNKTINGYVYHCGGKDYGDLKGKIADAKDLFKSMVPNFAGKMASTEN